MSIKESWRSTYKATEQVYRSLSSKYQFDLIFVYVKMWYRDHVLISPYRASRLRKRKAQIIGYNGGFSMISCETCR